MIRIDFESQRCQSSIPAGRGTTKRKLTKPRSPAGVKMATHTHKGALHYRAYSTPPPLPDLTRTMTKRPTSTRSTGFVSYGFV